MNELVCPACNYANESNRVFCQNCGMRLFAKGEETVLPELSHSQKKATEFERRGRVLNQGGGRSSFASLSASAIYTLVRLVVIAAMSAAVIQMVRAPETVPPVVEAFTKEQAAEFERKIIAARKIGDGKVFPIAVNDANKFLGQRVTLEPGLLAQFVRCYVAPDPATAVTEPVQSETPKVEASQAADSAETEKPKVQPSAVGKFYFGSQQNILVLSVYVQILFDVHYTENKGMQVRPEAASIGRLKIPSRFVPWMAQKAESTTTTIGGIVESLRRAETIKITPDHVNVTWPEIEEDDPEFSRK